MKIGSSIALVLLLISLLALAAVSQTYFATKDITLSEGKEIPQAKAITGALTALRFP